MVEVEVSAVDGPGSSPLLTMAGECDASDLELIEDFFRSWSARGHRHAVLDLTQVSLIDPTVISALVTAQIAGLTLTVRGTSGSVHAAFDIACVGDVLQIEAVPP